MTGQVGEAEFRRLSTEKQKQAYKDTWNAVKNGDTHEPDMVLFARLRRFKKIANWTEEQVRQLIQSAEQNLAAE